MNKIRFLFIFLIPFSLPAQKGGASVFDFLNFSSSPRIAALGGNLVPVQDNDVNIAFQQPCFISKNINNQLSFNFADYFADIQYGSLVLAKTLKKVGNFTAGIQYSNYGKFQGADENGNLNGNFYASDIALNIGWGRMLDSNLTLGANVKLISSSLENLHSSALALDVSLGYFDPKSQVSMSVLLKNAGFQFSGYIPGNKEQLPLELDFGISKRLKHIPFRYYLVYHDLQHWDLTYNDPNIVTSNLLDGSSVQKKSDFEKYADQFMRHIILAGEICFFKNLYFRMAYNYQKRQELKVETSKGTVGISWGFGIRVYKFSFNYARSAYHLVGSPNYLSITTNLSNFF